MMQTLHEHPGWKLLVQAATRVQNEKLVRDVVRMAEDKHSHAMDLLEQTRATLAESRKSVRMTMERAEAAEMKLARVQAYRDTCAILGQVPSLAGLERSLRDDDAPVRRAHNHPPYDPPCRERRVKGIIRGACLKDDGRDYE